MAMVLDAFASYLQGMLTEMAAEEIHLLLGVSVEIDKMGDKLKDLKNFLADADRRNITDKSVQEWVTELKRAMYDATDILDLCQLKAMESGATTVDAGCCNPLLFCTRNSFHAHDIGSRIKALNHRLDSIIYQSTTFNFINLWGYEDCGSSWQEDLEDCGTWEFTGQLDRSGVVGEKIEEDTRALVSTILQTRNEPNSNIMAVAIIGVGGIGKTTLARKVFNDHSIQGEFSKKIWLSISQNFSEVELLRRAIRDAGGDHHPAENAKATLQQILNDVLIGHKTLLVMDDVWNHQAWEGVLKTPLLNATAPSSRVIITTRHEGVGRSMKCVQTYHHVDKLNVEDAWSLLKKQVLSSEMDELDIDMLKDIGLKIAQRCDGLPLAIKLMGGLLRQRKIQRSDWEHVLDDPKWSMTKIPEELNYALYLSYEDMPPYLKQCFLFYSLIPKSTRFDVLHVVGMWISEGFIHERSNFLEESGRKYLKELISRNLIEQHGSDLEQSYCSMHDVVLSFGQYMVRDEALIAHNGETGVLSKLNSQKFLRLSIETNQLQSGELPDWKYLQEQRSLRTLILVKMKPGDSLATFSCLRILHIESVDVDYSFVESLHELKHLRYLTLVNTDISVLPGNIGKMKFLQFLDLAECKKLLDLPESISQLDQLRLLGIPQVSMIPRGFRSLTNIRRLTVFQAHMDGDWCSLDELGPLFQLRLLKIVHLENISAASSAANAMLVEKMHLIELSLSYTSRLGQDGLVKDKDVVSEEEQRQIEKVLDQLCPPPSVEHLRIQGYFGQQLPSWMMSKSMAPLYNLRSLLFSDLACCTQLPNGLCQLPCLQFLQIYRAPCIKSVGTEFLNPSKPAAAPFPRLQKMELVGMVEWEEWEWEKQVQAMPRLEDLLLENCKLRRLPPDLASQARALRNLSIKNVQHISYLENFPFVVELTVVRNLNLERISDLPNLQKLTITACPKLKVLKDVIRLQRLVLEDYYSMQTLPEYMRDVTLRHLELKCSLRLLTSIAAGQSGPELAKFSHVDHVKAKGYANRKEVYVLYRREPYSFQTNINLSFLFEGTLSFFEDAQRFDSVLKMPRTFNYICSIVKESSLQFMNGFTFLDGRFLCLEDQVAIALIVLNSGETLETIGSSVRVSEATVSLVTKSFVDAMLVGRWCHSRWPGTVEMEKIKSKFDKLHGLPNCCGVVHTTRIPFGYEDSNCGMNDEVLLQVVVDSDMRFTNVEFGWSGRDNQLSILLDSMLFTFCEDGRWLNGNKLKGSSDGSEEVGEYIIGDAGYPLLPWLLTPYQLKDKDLPDYQVEFNKMHLEAKHVALKDMGLSDYQVYFNKRHMETKDVALKAVKRFKDTWKWLHGGAWCPDNGGDLRCAVYVCCILNNIVIDVEEGAGVPNSGKANGSQQVRQLSDEDAVRARDVLSYHLTIRSTESRVDQEEKQQVVDDFKIGDEIPQKKIGEGMLVGKDEDEIVGIPSTSVFSEDDSELVGIDNPQEQLIRMLHLEDTQLKIVSICGTGGLGKTSIAKSVCRKIGNKFDCEAFVSVSSTPDMKEIVRHICHQVGSDCPDNEPVDKLRIFLQDKRYLILFDDIWDTSAWDKILEALGGGNNNHRSRIIITTRKVDVAEHVGDLYHLPLLSGNDSKMLFYRRTCFGSEDNCPSQFGELSKRMLSKCGQLPLAIIVITKLLPESKVLEEWQNACSSIERGRGMEDIRTVLKDSYVHISQDVKPCLLYLSIFPEGHEIRRDGLVQRWIAEDLISREDGRNLQELGESYFSELVNSSMIQPIEFDNFGKDLAYSVHVTTLDLIVWLSIEQDSVSILAGLQRFHLQDKIKRLSLQVSNEQYDVLNATKTVGQVSSLSVFSGADLIQSVSQFKGLHVLDLEKCDSLEDVHLNGLRKLYNLRYLALGSSQITVVPPKIRKLKDLQTLDLTATSVSQLPSSIAKLTQLRHLLINRSTKVPDKIIGKLQALEELVEIDISESPNILQEISTMPELRVLRIALWSWDEHHSKLLSEALCNLSTKKLKHLSISTCCSLDFMTDAKSVLQQLEKLEIEGSTFNTLPNLIGLLNNLRSLSIEVYRLENNALRILGKLSHLLFLSLTAKRTPGEKLVVGRDEFGYLETFVMFNHDMAIKFEQGAMKKLQRLKLSLQASVTKYFWFGLENLSSLKRVQVEIICFSATDGVVYKAEAALESMIGENPNNPTLEITRTEEKYKIEKKTREAHFEMKAKDEDQGAAEARQKNRVPEQSRRAEEKGRGTRGSIEDDLIYLT